MVTINRSTVVPSLPPPSGLSEWPTNDGTWNQTPWGFQRVPFLFPLCREHLGISDFWFFYMASGDPDATVESGRFRRNWLGSSWVIVHCLIGKVAPATMNFVPIRSLAFGLWWLKDLDPQSFQNVCATSFDINLHDVLFKKHDMWYFLEFSVSLCRPKKKHL